MAVTFEVASSDEHFNQILALQKKNHSATLTPEDQMAQGFVSIQHTLPLLKRMAAELPQVIALSGGAVVGYNLAIPVSMKDEIPLMVPLFSAFEEILYQGKTLDNYPLVVGGQVCVDSGFRGRGF